MLDHRPGRIEQGRRVKREARRQPQRERRTCVDHLSWDPTISKHDLPAQLAAYRQRHGLLLEKNYWPTHSTRLMTTTNTLRRRDSICRKLSGAHAKILRPRQTTCPPEKAPRLPRTHPHLRSVDALYDRIGQLFDCFLPGNTKITSVSQGTS